MKAAGQTPDDSQKRSRPILHTATGHSSHCRGRVSHALPRSTLQEHAHFEVCGEAVDGAEAVEAAKKLKPDVVVLNVTMPVMNGFEAARKIKEDVPQSAIVILSSNADRRFVEEAKNVGVRAYVAKTNAGEALVKAIEAAVRGEDFVVL
jgi:two-component system nitrate/nitrite response regulator NarL